MTHYKYYSGTPISRSEPTTVFKFNQEREGAVPERYSAGDGWIEDPRLFTLLIDGDLSESDVVSEEKALEIIQQIEEKFQNA